ncbi:uncharacterized protein LOC126906534 isoform X2 [Daktulosphaira vitifoliae]|uniref:uncharacterized protein LOC126906534 isoform X2 n=1 Tax=Daktulosphaira vitifoliae TaxID=58002 RepID=UPI0021AAD641|nr:uncharacterized protein LOC126906534 isoform X2 [Daktulosphaira vitifoliae]
MRWQIYCVFMFVYVSSSYIPISKCENSRHNRIKKFLKKTQYKWNKQGKKQIREVLFKTNNEISIEEIRTVENYKIPKEIEPIIQQITPDSNKLYLIYNVWKQLEKINDMDTTNIIGKLKKFNDTEYMSLRNFIQILTDKYFKIPKRIVFLFNDFLVRFHEIDTSNSGLISKEDFSSVIKAVLKNRDIIEHVLKPLENVENLNYEAWLLKKREISECISKIETYDIDISEFETTDEDESSDDYDDDNDEKLVTTVCFFNYKTV